MTTDFTPLNGFLRLSATSYPPSVPCSRLLQRPDTFKALSPSALRSKFFHSGSDSYENLLVRQASIWLKNQTVEKPLCD